MSGKTRSKFLLLSLLLLLTFGCQKRQTTQPTPQMDTDPKFWIRVLLTEKIQSCTISGRCGLDFCDPRINHTNMRLDVSKLPLQIAVIKGRITIADFPFDSNEILITPESPYILSLNGEEYRGKLMLELNPDSNSFDVINLIPLEPYLAGVIGVEIPSYWEPQALQAQAIAARTYCLYIKERFGNGRNWDLKKTQANQAYRGFKAETKSVWNAVNQTMGKVLICKYPDNTENFFPTYYSSTCGGHTENSKNVFGGEYLEPLQGVICPYCKEIAKSKLFFWSTITYSKNFVYDKLFKRYQSLSNMGKIIKIEILRQSDYNDFSRITMLKLIDANNKSDTIRAEDFRLAVDSSGLKLRSTSFKLEETKNNWIFSEGRGYGHAVGMCQCGAEAMAREGKNADEILQYYFPGSRIISLY